MADPSPEDAGARERRLARCIRDMAALNALPSMCIGRAPADALAVVLDALPTALGCDLLYVKLPGAPPIERAALQGEAVAGALLAEMAAAAAGDADGADAQLFLAGRKLWCL